MKWYRRTTPDCTGMRRHAQLRHATLSGRRTQRWKIRVLCGARVVLLGHWLGVRENHAPTHARGAWRLGINWQGPAPGARRGQGLQLQGSWGRGRQLGACRCATVKMERYSYSFPFSGLLASPGQAPALFWIHGDKAQVQLLCVATRIYVRYAALPKHRSQSSHPHGACRRRPCARVRSPSAAAPYARCRPFRCRR